MKKRVSRRRNTRRRSSRRTYKRRTGRRTGRRVKRRASHNNKRRMKKRQSLVGGTEPDHEPDNAHQEGQLTLNDLPKEVLENIAKLLPDKDVVSLSAVDTVTRSALSTDKAKRYLNKYGIDFNETHVYLPWKLRETRLEYLDALCRVLFLLPNLQELTLSHNRLTALPESLGGLQNLQLLNLSDNQLTTLPESLGNLQNLQTLNLRNNQLTALPESLGNLQGLRNLYLSDNQLTNPDQNPVVQRLRKAGCYVSV